MKNPHNIMDADIGATKRLIAAIVLQAAEDLEIKDDSKGVQHKKDSINFFWGSNSKISDAYLSILDYNPKDFKDKLKAKMEAAQMAVQ